MEGRGEEEQEAKEGGMLAVDEIMKVVPTCFRNRLVRRVEGGGKERRRSMQGGRESGRKGGKEVVVRLSSPWSSRSAPLCEMGT